jgi:hypothetical protein
MIWVWEIASRMETKMKRRTFSYHDYTCQVTFLATDNILPHDFVFRFHHVLSIYTSKYLRRVVQFYSITEYLTIRER